MKLTLRALAEKLACHLLGDGSITVTAVSSLQSAAGDSLVFVEDARYLEAALHSSAAAVIAGDFASEDFDAIAVAAKPVLISPQPRLTFARAARLLRDPDRNRVIHASAIVPPSAGIGKNVAIGPRAILGENVKVGDETTIGAGSVIGDDAVIGSHCRIDPNVTIYPGVTLGHRVIVQAGAILGSEGFGYVRDSRNRTLRAIPANRAPGNRRRCGYWREFNHRPGRARRNPHSPRREDRQSSPHRPQRARSERTSSSPPKPASPAVSPSKTT